MVSRFIIDGSGGAALEPDGGRGRDTVSQRRFLTVTVVSPAGFL